jgi:hypothetical protein
VPYKDREEKLAYHKQYNDKWYPLNREQRIAQIRERKWKLWEWYRNLKKSMACSKCPESDYRCLDFHHRDPSEKYKDVSVLVNTGCSKERILEEITKCDILCANCHRKATIRKL